MSENTVDLFEDVRNRALLLAQSNAPHEFCRLMWDIRSHEDKDMAELAMDYLYQHLPPEVQLQVDIEISANDLQLSTLLADVSNHQRLCTIAYKDDEGEIQVETDMLIHYSAGCVDMTSSQEGVDDIISVDDCDISTIRVTYGKGCLKWTPDGQDLKGFLGQTVLLAESSFSCASNGGQDDSDREAADITSNGIQDAILVCQVFQLQVSPKFSCACRASRHYTAWRDYADKWGEDALQEVNIYE